MNGYGPLYGAQPGERPQPHAGPGRAGLAHGPDPGPENPGFCREGSDHASAMLYPKGRTGRHLTVFDPATQEYRFVDTCFSTHHLQFA